MKKKTLKKQKSKTVSKTAKKKTTKPEIKYKAVLFDLDGVLVDMPDGHYESLNKALSVFGVEIARDEHVNHFNGLPTRKKLEELEKQERLPAGLREFINELKQKHTKEVIPKHCPPEYSKIILMRYLKDRGMLIGCCSNSIKETLHLMLKSAHLYDHFDIIIGNDEVTNPKPHPEIYLTAMQKLNLLPHEVIIVEDAPHGIASARASGAHVIEVKGTEDVNISLFEDILM